MAVKTNQDLKRRRKMEKRAKVDKAANWFMINMAWGVLGFLILRYLENSLIMNMVATQNVMKVVAIIIGVGAVVLAVLGFASKSGTIKCIKNSKRAFDYAIFSAVVAAVALYLGFYHNVRNVVISVLPFLGSLQSGWWTTDALSILIGIYLVAAFVFTAVKIWVIEHKK